MSRSSSRTGGIAAARDRWERLVSALAAAKATRETLLKTIRAVCQLYEIKLTKKQIKRMAAAMDHSKNDLKVVRDIKAACEIFERKLRVDECNSMLRALCRSFQIELTDERRAHISTWEPERLRDLIVEISDSRQWPL